MVSSIASPYSIVYWKLANFRSNLIREIKLRSLSMAAKSTASPPSNVAAKEYLNFHNPLEESSSIITSRAPFNQYYQLQETVRKIRETLASKSINDDQLEELIMIDTIQRLGLEYYFQDEINAALRRLYIKFYTFEEDCSRDLRETALHFRLLRQNGYNVAADVFSKFKDSEDEFNQHSNDVKGLLSLFEASKFRILGENILDEAGNFSEQVLTAILAKNILEQAHARIIENTLRNPLNRRLARILTASSLKDLSDSLQLLHGFCDLRKIEWVKDIEELARIDLDMSQMSHRSEIIEISRWGKELSIMKELRFARIQPFKWYIWSLGTLPGPDMAEERIELAKSVSFIYMIDDIFDAYGTLDELTLFTEAVNRWDHTDIVQLPHYMKVCFMALHHMVKDVSHKTLIMRGWDPENLLRKAWGDLCNSFLREAKWFASGDLPSSEEYLKNGIVSVGVPLVLMHAFFLLGRGINKTSVDALNDLPPFVSSAEIVRLWNDVGTDKDANRDDKDGSYIDCYMKEHNISAESARKHVNQLISDAWKRLNEECLSPSSPFSAEFKAAWVNIARMASIMYSFDENHRLSDLQKHLNVSLKETLNV